MPAVAPDDRRTDRLGHRRGVRRFVRAARRCWRGAHHLPPPLRVRRRPGSGLL